MTGNCFLFSQEKQPLALNDKTNLAAAKIIDDYIDLRFDAQADSTVSVLRELEKIGITEMADLENAVRAPRSEYPDHSNLIGKTTHHEIECYHVDYKTKFLMYVPEDLDTSIAAPLVIVGHGGNSSMSPERAESTARLYLRMYAPAVSKEMKAVVVAPVSGRGWGQIGNSIIFTTISKVQRMLPIDPDRIFITGQSMGGHLSFRSALTFPDRWGAVSPQSGGYDYVEKNAIGNLVNVPGYAIWGAREPYGINGDNRTNAAWAKKQEIDWKFVEKNGGHTIYRDELPSMAKFFMAHARNLYRDQVYMRQGGAMKFTKTWEIKGWPEHTIYSDKRPLRWNIRHWIEVDPAPDAGEPITVMARLPQKNTFDITTNQVRKMAILLHPKMVDFDRPIVVTVNGKKAFEGHVKPDPKLMLELVKEFDDRGRIFWARLPLEIDTDLEFKFKASPKDSDKE